MDINDLSIVLANFGKTSGMWWATGDFYGSGTVDINDLTLVLSNYNDTLGAMAVGAAGVPEPSIMAILAGAAGLLAWAGIWKRGVGSRGADQISVRLAGSQRRPCLTGSQQRQSAARSPLAPG